VLVNLLDTVEANHEGTVDALDPEFLHDLRVAVRRSRSVVSAGKKVLPADERKRFGAELKWLGGATGPSRDLDVYVIEWDGYVAPLGETAPLLTPVRDHLDRQRQRAHADLAKQLRSRRYKALVKQWRSFLETPSDDAEPGRLADRTVGEVAAARITAAHDHLVEQGRLIDADSPGEALHDLRKDAKKLRYLLECFGGLYEPKARKTFVQRLKALQDNLGEHQDAEVHVDLLRTVAPEIHGSDATGPETLLAMGQLIAHLEQRRVTLRGEFADRFADFDTKKTRRALVDLLASAGSGS
jgi:CHAD domain-containing protein